MQIHTYSKYLAFYNAWKYQIGKDSLLQIEDSKC